MTKEEQRKHDRDRYASRRARLLCAWCEAPETVASLCDKCRKKNNKRFIARRKKRRKQSKCGYCGAKISKNFTQCLKCRKLHQTSRKANIEKGLCFCGRERFQGRFYCAIHLIKANQHQRRRLARKKQRGECRACKLPMVTKQYCEKHNKMYIIASEKARLKRWAARRAAKQCVLCGKPAVTLSYCEFHRKKQIEKYNLYIKRRRERNKQELER